MTNLLVFAASTAALSVAAAAQTAATLVPSNARTADQVAVRRIAGVDAELRQQLLIDPVHLQAMLGRTVRSVRFRRDTSSVRDALAGGSVQLRVWLSTAPSPALDASASFALNRGVDRTLVFDGSVALPASPAVTSVGAPAAFDFVVDLDPAAPFVYQGGTLALEIEGTPGAGASSWPIDAIVATGPSGQVDVVGASCGAMSNNGRFPTAHLGSSEMTPGSTARVLLRAEPNAPAMLLVALDAHAGLLDLSMLGFAPGCALHVGPILTSLVTVAAPQAVSPRLGAPAAIDLQLPSDSSFVGARLGVQWIEISRSGLRTSNGLRMTAAPLRSDLGMTLVEASGRNGTFPSAGRVDTRAGLVVQFGHD